MQRIVGAGVSLIYCIDEGTLRALNGAAIRRIGRYVLYWSQMNRRAVTNQALDYSVMQANSFGISGPFL